mmetsp:Transcript_34688/g.99643  ORF Transcript_34688/g.99643 Transcript_34688/m.99643 type:complete len:121 (-) Transcript_34688:57-419(-)
MGQAQGSLVEICCTGKSDDCSGLTPRRPSPQDVGRLPKLPIIAEDTDAERNCTPIVSGRGAQEVAAPPVSTPAAVVPPRPYQEEDASSSSGLSSCYSDSDQPDSARAREAGLPAQRTAGG